MFALNTCIQYDKLLFRLLPICDAHWQLWTGIFESAYIVFKQKPQQQLQQKMNQKSIRDTFSFDRHRKFSILWSQRSRYKIAKKMAERVVFCTQFWMGLTIMCDHMIYERDFFCAIYSLSLVVVGRSCGASITIPKNLLDASILSLARFLFAHSHANPTSKWQCVFFVIFINISAAGAPYSALAHTTNIQQFAQHHKCK